MFVAIDKITTVRMYELIKKHWDERIDELEKALAQVADDQDLIYRSDNSPGCARRRWP